MIKRFFSNAFNRFNLPISFNINQSQLKLIYYNLMKLNHPDINKSGLDNSINIINDYNILVNPLLRIEHIIKLKGIVIPDRMENEEVIDILEQLEEGNLTNDMIKENINNYYNKLEKAFNDNDKELIIKNFMLYKLWYKQMV